MLEDLNIRNFALIDSVSVEFNEGFTVLSGETGAGKSILIGSLSFLLGGKASVEQIRAGCAETEVSGTFCVENSAPARKWLDERGISIEEGRVLLRRALKSTGKSAAWINGSPVSRADLAEFSMSLVDIHGQHEHQSLMHPASHRIYLDSYAGITAKVEKFTEIYRLLIERRAELERLRGSGEERQKRAEMLRFAADEIEGMKLKEDEEDVLLSEEARLSSYEKLFSDLDSINQILSDGESSVLPMLKKAKGFSGHAAGIDKKLCDADSRLESLFYELGDVADEFRSYSDSLVYDPKRLEEVQERLNAISKLKKKYVSPNSSIKELVSYAENARAELESIDSGAENVSRLEAELDKIEAQAYAAAAELSKERRAASDKMASEVEAILCNLGMKSTRFSVQIRIKEDNDVAQKCGPYGMDDVEFLISANPGSPMLPLARIASGGELSRVMLALKTVLAAGDEVDTLVFDEIDTGIGGEVAVAVGSHIKNLSGSKQVLCITHLASIAVYADNQMKIQKNSVEGGSQGSTSTSVFPICGEERVQEVARMLSGDTSDTQSLEHARSMLLKCGGFNG